MNGCIHRVPDARHKYLANCGFMTDDAAEFPITMRYQIGQAWMKQLLSSTNSTTKVLVICERLGETIHNVASRLADCRWLETVGFERFGFSRHDQ